MIQTQTKLKITDNSGGNIAVCIKVLKGSKRRYAKIGDIIKVAIKTISSNSKVKKGSVSNAVIVRTKKGIRRNDGSLIKFDDNAVVLLNDKFELLGTRIFGPVARELRTDQYMKIISLSPEVL